MKKIILNRKCNISSNIVGLSITQDTVDDVVWVTTFFNWIAYESVFTVRYINLVLIVLFLIYVTIATMLPRAIQKLSKIYA